MIKVDLHTHSNDSPDGGLSEEDYQTIIENKLLDCIAITDHDAIDFALKMHNKYPNNFIVGQEITTNQGDIIGLFLKKLVKPHTSIQDAVSAIKQQNGLVYIPHPFETVRKGITKESLKLIQNNVDIVEANNGRAVFQNKGPQAVVWARLNNVVIASSSDAHGIKGMGTSYTKIAELPDKDNLVKLLKMGRLATKRPPLISLLYPKYHRLRGKISMTKNSHKS